MSKVIFITGQTRENEGSENLWISAAIHLSECGYSVKALVPQDWQSGDMVKTFKKHSIETAYLKNKGFTRLLLKLASLSGRKRSLSICSSLQWGSLSPEKTDCLLLNQGGIYDMAFQKNLYKYLDDKRLKYFINARSGRGVEGINKETRHATRRFFEGAHGVIVPAFSNIRDIEEELSIKIHNWKVIHSPIKNWRDGPLPYPGGDTVKIAFTGRLEIEEKGLDLLLSAARYALDKGYPFEYSIYGDGPDRGRLNHHLKEMDLGSSVVLRGRYSSLDEVWGTHHVHVLPSRSEGQPQSLMEAMMAGRASVVTPVGGMGDLVVDGETGLVMDSPEKSSLHSAMDKLAEGRNILPKLGLAAHQRAQKCLYKNPQKILCEFITEGDQ